MAARDLEQELIRLDTGSEWVRYLLSDEIFIGKSSSHLSTPLPPRTDLTYQQSLERLVDVQARFNAVIQNPAYRAIVRLPSFKTTYDRLTAYVALLSETPSEPPAENRPIELLPTPQPESH